MTQSIAVAMRHAIVCTGFPLCVSCLRALLPPLAGALFARGAFFPVAHSPPIGAIGAIGMLPLDIIAMLMHAELSRTRRETRRRRGERDRRAERAGRTADR